MTDTKVRRVSVVSKNDASGAMNVHTGARYGEKRVSSSSETQKRKKRAFLRSNRLKQPNEAMKR